MRVLIIKTSSLGDVAHMLPAITDAASQIHHLHVDWLVEESFQSLPNWHPSVEEVYPVAIRRWRKNLLNPQVREEIRDLRKTLRKNDYDLILDTQGLIKSAALTRLPNKTDTAGYAWTSAREPLASLFYKKRYTVSREQHAIDRNRQLTAQALGYEMRDLPLDYGLDGWMTDLYQPQQLALPDRFCMALHGTSRADKEWPEENWITLGKKLAEEKRPLVFPWGNDREHDRAHRLAAETQGMVLPKLGLEPLAAIMSKADKVIGMDTGLMHIAAALGKGGVAIYLTSKPELTGVKTAVGKPTISSLDKAFSDVENVYASL